VDLGRLKKLRSLGLQSIGITSNGIALHRKLPTLVDNGLTHLNLSLDTLDPFKFELITRRSGHDAVLKSFRAALQNPRIKTVKLNVVIMRGVNDNEVLDFVDLTKELNVSVRFIEVGTVPSFHINRLFVNFPLHSSCRLLVCTDQELLPVPSPTIVQAINGVKIKWCRRRICLEEFPNNILA